MGSRRGHCRLYIAHSTFHLIFVVSREISSFLIIKGDLSLGRCLKNNTVDIHFREPTPPSVLVYLLHVIATKCLFRQRIDVFWRQYYNLNQFNMKA